MRSVASSATRVVVSRIRTMRKPAGGKAVLTRSRRARGRLPIVALQEAATRRRSRSFHPWCAPSSSSRTPPPSSPRRASSTRAAPAVSTSPTSRAPRTTRSSRRGRAAFARRRALAEELSALCPHYSVKFNSEGRDRTARAQNSRSTSRSRELNVGECLLVSGSGPRLRLARAARGARRRGIQAARHRRRLQPVPDRPDERAQPAAAEARHGPRVVGVAASAPTSRSWMTRSPSSASSSVSASCRSCASTARSSCRRASSSRR